MLTSKETAALQSPRGRGLTKHGQNEPCTKFDLRPRLFSQPSGGSRVVCLVAVACMLQKLLPLPLPLHNRMPQHAASQVGRGGSVSGLGLRRGLRRVRSWVRGRGLCLPWLWCHTCPTWQLPKLFVYTFRPCEKARHVVKSCLL